MNESRDTTLSAFMKSSRIDTSLFFSMAMQLVERVQERHQSTPIPHGINPDTIGVVVNGEQVTLRWIDESQEHAEQAYAYMSPEHAGRMFRQPDHRSDLYGIGVLFYEWLTGETPFKAHSLGEWMHAHMAKLPVPVSARQPQVPGMVNDLVMKLLSKSPEDRYQSAYGLLDDLRKGSEAWRAEGTIHPFPLGSLDARSSLRLPDKLVGRAREWQQLVEVYDRSTRGSKELLFIGGHTGSGKSALVQAFRDYVWQRDGYGVVGKCEPLQESKPYAPFITAITELIRQIVAGGEEQVQSWKAKLSRAVGQSGNVLTHVMPELSWLLGKPMPVEPLSPVEATNRFRRLFANVIQAFADEKHPLVIGLDDLQWADSATLQLLAELWHHSSLKHVMIIGTYRDHEVNEEHRLHELFLDTPESAVAPIGVMHIQGLSYPEVLRYLSDMLQTEAEEIRPFADVLYPQTAGNPLYLNEMVQTCHERSCLYFNAERMGWEWDLPAMQEMVGFQHVVDLIRSRIHMLPEATRRVLGWAGCLGASFPLEKLSLVTGQSTERVMDVLLPAVSEGWLVVEQGRMRFLHDQVQRVAYDLISEADKQQVHLDIGRSLLNAFGTDAEDEHLFEIVHHLNTGRVHMTEFAEAERLARLNLRAGKKAKASAAYGQASELLTIGARLVERAGWHGLDALYAQLVLERTECLYFGGHIDQAETDLRQLLQHTEALPVRARIYATMVMMYSFHKRMEEAAATALEAMNEFGFSIPISTSRSAMLIEVARTQLALANKRMQLSELPNNDDARHQALSEIVMVSASVIYVVNPQLAVVLFAKYVRLSLRQGLGDAFSIALGSYAITLAFGLGSHKTALQLVETAWHYAEQSDRLLLKGKIQVIMALVMQYAHPQQVDALFEQAGQMSIECGDLVNAGNAIACHLIVSDLNLRRLDQMCKAYEEPYGQVLDEITLRVLHIARRYVERLQHDAGDDSLVFNIPNMPEDVPGLEDAWSSEEKGNWFYFYTCKLEVAFLYGRYAEAVALAEKARMFEKEIMVTVNQKYVFYYALAMMAMYRDRAERWNREHRTKLRPFMNRMRKWSNVSPNRTLAKYRIMQAAYASLHGQDEKALRLYDQAIEEAQQAGECRDEAIAAELAAGVYLRRNERDRYEAYLQIAGEAYDKWGASGKVKALQDRVPSLASLASLQSATTHPKAKTETHSTAAARQDTSLRKDLDMEMLRQISQSLIPYPSEVAMSATFLQLALHTAGAERGLVLFADSGELLIHAQQEMNDAQEALTQESRYSASVVQYVHRTKESVVVGEAGQSLFASEAYIQHHKPRSILCMAIRDADHREGVLYLENNLTANAFTEDRVDMLELIFSRMVYAEHKQSGDRSTDLPKAPNSKEPSPLVESLTSREMEIVHLIAEGLSNKQIALRLDITEGTVKSHANNIYGKLQVNKRVQAIKKARELQIVE
ncbi:AAA family ATPase [Marinicrinis sediminis]|uniref:AAA family ATPase n=1 Tax=Marinicrinis sediminis TaxID=1652465 RepID=A0ABW5RB36_9BACL